VLQSRTPEVLQDSRTGILKIHGPAFLAERGSALPDRHLRTTEEGWKDERACDRKVLSVLPLGGESRESKAKLYEGREGIRIEGFLLCLSLLRTQLLVCI
jgi:hypothetical protein